MGVVPKNDGPRLLHMLGSRYTGTQIPLSATTSCQHTYVYEWISKRKRQTLPYRHCCNNEEEMSICLFHRPRYCINFPSQRKYLSGCLQYYIFQIASRITSLGKLISSDEISNGGSSSALGPSLQLQQPNIPHTGQRPTPDKEEQLILGATAMFHAPAK
uniref:Uncharacterized protein LOC117357727 isoform X2 n=1 Tax=Geotrypetes seraphini TaxID=260995 RepID=A0A6P8QFK0_GEOSA|nr:uncharacterized protein LOC117357727 isoform X2 [Geotrypetes seraphini]